MKPRILVRGEVRDIFELKFKYNDGCYYVARPFAKSWREVTLAVTNLQRVSPDMSTEIQHAFLSVFDFTFNRPVALVTFSKFFADKYEGQFPSIGIVLGPTKDYAGKWSFVSGIMDDEEFQGWIRALQELPPSRRSICLHMGGEIFESAKEEDSAVYSMVKKIKTSLLRLR